MPCLSIEQTDPFFQGFKCRVFEVFGTVAIDISGKTDDVIRSHLFTSSVVSPSLIIKVESP